jgi:hypothetical protein
MRKIITMSLKGSVVLMAIAGFISVSEISCQKASASPTTTLTPHYTLITRQVNATNVNEMDLMDSIGNLTPIPLSPDVAGTYVYVAKFNALKTAIVYSLGSTSTAVYTYTIATGVTTKTDLSSTSSSVTVQDTE